MSKLNPISLLTKGSDIKKNRQKMNNIKQETAIRLKSTNN